ncbi:MAG TPA: CorA family divalent cation transporter, partial [Rhizomicrobium sp.]
MRSPAPKSPLVTQSFGQSAGVLWGYRIRAGVAEPVSEETLADCLADTDSWLWLHFALSDHRARRFLENFEPAPQAARAFVLGTEKRVQLHLSHDWSFGILPDLEKDFAGNSLGVGRLNFMADRRHLITARHHPMRVVDDIRPTAETTLQDPASVLVRHVERFIDIVEARLNDLSG